MGVLVFGLVAFADSDRLNQDVRNARTANYSLNTADRNGTCWLGLSVPDSIAYYWTWKLGEGFGHYVDPATDQPLGVTCGYPYYPFMINGVDFMFGLYGTSAMVGHTATFQIDIMYPSNIGTAFPDGCSGPGDIICTQTVNYVVTEYDYDSLAYVEMYVPLDNCCVDHPFYYSVRLVNWDGAFSPATEAPVYFSKGSAIPNQGCRVWWYTSIAVGGVYGPPCWNDITSTYVTPWGSWGAWLNGTAGASCEPVSPVPCVSGLPGENKSHCLLVDNTPGVMWQRVFNLCDYCSDYNQADADELGGGAFTANGGDLVLCITPSTDPCFQVLIEPLCAQTTWFRIRSWINDDYGTFYDGSPRFPVVGASQVYNFTDAGLGCLPAGNYYLYIDARGCCCPIRVSIMSDVQLPVEVTSLDAVAGDGRVTLNWATTTENDVNHFNVMRNGTVLTHVDGLGNSPTGHHYTFVDNSVTNGLAYTYSLQSVDGNGTVRSFDQSVTATPRAALVTEYTLAQNFPNPFNPSTTISYAVKDAGLVSLKVYTIDGREVMTLVNGTREAGNYSVTFNGNDFASGVYLYKLDVNGFAATHKMVLMK